MLTFDTMQAFEGVTSFRSIAAAHANLRSRPTEPRSAPPYLPGRAHMPAHASTGLRRTRGLRNQTRSASVVASGCSSMGKCPAPSITSKSP